MPRVIQIPATSIMVYTPRELREKSPAAYKVALARWQKKQQNDPDDYYNREIVKSLKALISAAGLEMKDWSLGAYNQNNFLKVAGFQENSEDDSKSAENFTGRRAMAWMENNLYRKLRVPFAPPAVR